MRSDNGTHIFFAQNLEMGKGSTKLAVFNESTQYLKITDKH